MDAGCVADVAGSPFVSVGVAERVQRSIDGIRFVSAESESRAAFARSQSSTWVSSLVHGGQAVDVAVVKPEERVEGRAGDDGHVAADEDVDTTVDTFQVFRGRVELVTGEVVQSSLPAAWECVLQPLVVGATGGPGAEAGSFGRTVMEFVAEERVVDGRLAIGGDDIDPLLLHDLWDAGLGASGGPIPVRVTHPLGGSEVSFPLVTGELVGDGDGFAVEHLLVKC